MFWVTSLYSFCDPIIVFRNLPVSEMSEFLEVCVNLGQIAKLSPGTLVGYTELGLSDLLPILVLGLQLLLLSSRYFGLFYICLMRVLLMST